MQEELATGKRISFTDFEKAITNRNMVIGILMAGQVVSGLGQALVFVAQGDYVAFYGTE